MIYYYANLNELYDLRSKFIVNKILDFDGYLG